MSLNLGFIGKKIQDLEGGVTNFFRGAGNAVGQGIDNVVPGNQSYLHPNIQPQPQQQQRPSPLPPPLFQQALGGLPGVNLASTFGSALKQSGQGVSNATDQAANWANQHDNNLSLPVVGNAADTVAGFLKSPAQTAIHVGDVLQGHNPYQGMSTPQAIGSGATDALNALTFGKGKLLVDAGERIGAPIVSKLGGGTLARAAGNLVGTTVATAPVTAGYGASSVLQSGDTNPAHIAQGALQGAAAAPILGTLHAAVPVVKAGAKGVKGAVTPKSTPISSLKIGSDAMDQLNQDRVNQIHQDILLNRPIEPVVTKNVGGQLYVQDGAHRLAAAQQAGLTHVPTIDQAQFLANQRGEARLFEPNGTPPEGRGQSGPAKPGQTPPQTNQLPEGQPVPVKPKVSARSSSSKTTPPDALAQALELDRTPSANAEPVTMASVEKGIRNAQNLSPRPDEATQYAINRKLSAEQNPVKVDIPTVNPGDYPKARSNTQLASNPLQISGNHAATLADRLSPAEKANFWNMVENPSLAKTPEAKAAVEAWNHTSNTSHATSQALGGDSGYLKNYDFRNIDTGDAGTQKALTELNGGNPVSPEDFQGLDRLARKIPTRADAEAMGIKFKNPGNPAADIKEYVQSRAGVLRNKALIKGLTEADSENLVKNRSLDLGNGQVIPLSEKGIRESKTFSPNRPTPNKVVKSVRTVNQTLKSTILSLGQFHTINIGALRAAPTLILRGHPVAAGKGLYRMFRGAFGSQYADRVIGNALKDGTVEKAARIGMPYGGEGYSTEGTFLKHGVGSRTVFGKQIPMMHDQVARSIISDLEKKGISLDSPEARQAGLAGAHLMGEMNHAVENISPATRRAMSDWMLAGQFTPSKFEQVGTALNPKAYTKGGVAGKYAAANVLANVAATTAISTGLGALLKQKSDDARDILLRALIDPAVPTPFKDDKGNTDKLRLPGTDASDIAKLIGVTLVRQSDGHLGVDWKPSNMPTTVTDFLRARLSPLAGAAVKVATNTNFANKPLYDPNASLGTKIAQAGTSLGVGELPIGLQGLAYTGAVKNAAPGDIKDVLNAQTPGSNPVLKSLGSSFGLTPSTDQTVGKGLQSSQYFSGLDQAKQGLNKREQDAIDILTGGKKNPVTGKYEVDPTVYDSPTKANLLLQNPKVLQNLTTLNQKLASEGQKVDPFYSLSPDQQVKALQIDRLDPQNPDKTQNIKLAGQWYQDFQNARQGFFDSLPPGDPNKPKAPVQFVAPDASTQSLMDKYDSIDDAGQKEQFIKNNPAVQTAFDNAAAYDKAIRSARGLPELKGYPTASPGLQAKLDQYNTLGKASRGGFIKANPDVSAYFQRVSQYSLEKDATQARYVGNDFTPKGVKAIQSLGNDIYYNGGLLGSQGQTIAPTGSTGVSGAATAKARSSAKSSNYKVSSALKRVARKVSFSHVSLPTGGNSKGRAYPKTISNVYVKQARSSVASKSRPKVTIKKSLA